MESCGDSYESEEAKMVELSKNGKSLEHHNPDGGFRKGHKKLGGRKKGSPHSKDLNVIRSHIVKALEKLGGVDYLVALGRDEPRVFATLLARAMPTQISATVDNGKVITAELEDDELQQRLAELRNNYSKNVKENIIEGEIVES